jgi:hypothetical protein
MAGRARKFPLLLVTALAALSLLIQQPVLVSAAAPAHSSLLCFCETGASKPTNTVGFAGLSEGSLLIIAVAAVLASIMGIVLVRLMRRS